MRNDGQIVNLPSMWQKYPKNSIAINWYLNQFRCAINILNQSDCYWLPRHPWVVGKWPSMLDKMVLCVNKMCVFGMERKYPKLPYISTLYHWFFFTERNRIKSKTYQLTPCFIDYANRTTLHDKNMSDKKSPKMSERIAYPVSCC